MSDPREMGNVSNSDRLWAKTYDEIKNKHDEAFVAIEQAITLEEREKPNEVGTNYLDIGFFKNLFTFSRPSRSTKKESGWLTKHFPYRCSAQMIPI